MSKEINEDRILQMYEKMYLIRQYEEKIYYLFLEGEMPGTIHQCQGQEATAVGMLFDIRKEDYITSTHRPAGHSLAKGVPLKSMMAEMFAKANGCSKAKGGAMHIGDMSVGATTSIAIVGGGIPVAVGIGLSCKMKKTDNVVVCFFGDGASNEGAFHEALNGASIWDLPIVFACENNQYGASTHIKKVINIENIADRAAAYGIPGEIVDGNDVLKVNEAANSAVERARAGKGPTLLELKTYRISGHSRSDANKYRPEEEEEKWFAHDPIDNLEKYILENEIANNDNLAEIRDDVEQQIEEAIAYAKASPDPEPEDALKHVYYEGGE